MPAEDKDLRWIGRENLKKQRLIKLAAGWQTHLA